MGWVYIPGVIVIYFTHHSPRYSRVLFMLLFENNIRNHRICKTIFSRDRLTITLIM